MIRYKYNEDPCPDNGEKSVTSITMKIVFPLNETLTWTPCGVLNVPMLTAIVAFFRYQ